MQQRSQAPSFSRLSCACYVSVSEVRQLNVQPWHLSCALVHTAPSVQLQRAAGACLHVHDSGHTPAHCSTQKLHTARTAVTPQQQAQQPTTAWRAQRRRSCGAWSEAAEEASWAQQACCGEEAACTPCGCAACQALAYQAAQAQKVQQKSWESQMPWSSAKLYVRRANCSLGTNSSRRCMARPNTATPSRVATRQLLAMTM